MSTPPSTTLGSPPLRNVSDRALYTLTALVTVIALAVLTWIVAIRQVDGAASIDLRFMPGVNATLNTLAATLLTIGWIAARRRAWKTHMYCQIAAFGASTLFLIGYLAYHWVHGDTKFAGQGTVRTVYLLILATHIVLSTVIVPGALVSFVLGFKGRYGTHRKLARIVLPIWLYVSVTGVIIYLMLHRGWFV